MIKCRFCSFMIFVTPSMGTHWPLVFHACIARLFACMQVNSLKGVKTLFSKFSAKPAAAAR